MVVKLRSHGRPGQVRYPLVRLAGRPWLPLPPEGDAEPLLGLTQTTTKIFPRRSSLGLPGIYPSLYVSFVCSDKSRGRSVDTSYFRVGFRWGGALPVVAGSPPSRLRRSDPPPEVFGKKKYESGRAEFNGNRYEGPKRPPLVPNGPKVISEKHPGSLPVVGLPANRFRRPPTLLPGKSPPGSFPRDSDVQGVRERRSVKAP